MARFQRLACPSCGDALDVPTEHAQFFKCATCGATLEDTQYTAPTQQVSVSVADVFAATTLDATALTAYAARAGKVATRAGKVIAAIVTLSVLGSIGAGAYGVYRGVSAGTGVGGRGGFNMYNFANSALFAGEGSTSEVALAVGGPDKTHLIYVDLGATEQVRWDAALRDLLPTDASIASYERIVASPGQVLLTHHDGLYAFDRTDGTHLYKLGLSDSVTNICADCLRIFGGTRAAILTQDGRLRVWDVATGAEVWNKQLPGAVPRQLLDVGGNPAVAVDQPADREDRQRAVLTVFDIVTGEEVHTQAPRCDTDFPRTLGAYDQLVDLGASGYVWLGDCPQLWAPGADAPTWLIDHEAAAAIKPATFQPNPVVTAERIVFAVDDGVASMSRADGSFVVVERNELSTLTPVALVGDTIVAAERSSRGSRRWSLAGIDTTNPQGQAMQPAWQLALDGEPGDDGMITATEWIVHVTPAGVVVVQFDVGGGTLRFQVVDPATGIAAAPNTLELGGLMFAEVVGWRDGNLLLGADRHLQAIDPLTATIVAQAP
ncbi:MAG TPA: PQQ-binding-like beta-propeller repeat protein [Ilumatobacter sp.]|nr:PQQ-binding-like beta-propeller repeat protein [Ilumatobacter sp.]